MGFLKPVPLTKIKKKENSKISAQGKKMAKINNANNDQKRHSRIKGNQHLVGDIVPRANDYCGVVTKEEYKKMR